MKSIAMYLCVLLAVLDSVSCLQDKKTKVSCNTVLENKNVSFEYNFYPGNQLVPGYKTKCGYALELPSTGNNKLTYTNEAAWETEKCGDSLCIVSRKQDWENYYLTSNTWSNFGLVPCEHINNTQRVGKYGLAHNLVYYEDIKEADPAWTVQYDIECDDCSKMAHCYIIHRFKGNSEEMEYFRMFVVNIGLYLVAIFGSPNDYDHTYDDWFDWAIHVQDHVPAGADGPVSFNWIILATAALWLSGC